MFKKKPSTQNNPYQNNGSNISEKLKTPISSSKYSKPNITSQRNQLKYSGSQKTPDYANISKNSGYQEE